jgi:8-oxo-dGTP pyrophosphatase MutT (NUDIX family)
MAAAAVVLDRRRVLLVKQNYGLRRWSLPGGAVEPEESPAEAAVRELREEAAVELRIAAMLGIYHFTYRSRRHQPWLGLAFLGTIEAEPSPPDSGEIAEIGWFEPRRLPSSITNFARVAIPDALSGGRGLVRLVELD